MHYVNTLGDIEWYMDRLGETDGKDAAREIMAASDMRADILAAQDIAFGMAATRLDTLSKGAANTLRRLAIAVNTVCPDTLAEFEYRGRSGKVMRYLAGFDYEVMEDVPASEWTGIGVSLTQVPLTVTPLTVDD